jgi:hypothetical protein
MSMRMIRWRGRMDRAFSPHGIGDDGSWGAAPGWYGHAPLALGMGQRPGGIPGTARPRLAANSVFSVAFCLNLFIRSKSPGDGDGMDCANRSTGQPRIFSGFDYEHEDNYPQIIMSSC